MLSDPTSKLVVEKLAEPEVTVALPSNVVPLKNETVPFGVLPVIFAVNVTTDPDVDVVVEACNTVVDAGTGTGAGAGSTVNVLVTDVLAPLLPPPG